MSNNENQTTTEAQAAPAAVPVAEEGNKSFEYAAYLDFFKFWNSDVFRSNYKSWKTEYISPLCKEYEQLPQQITDWKRDNVIDPKTISARFIGLSAATLFVAVASKAAKTSFLRVLRNTGFSFFGFGTVLVPEVFNPFLVLYECEECSQHEAKLKTK